MSNRMLAAEYRGTMLQYDTAVLRESQYIKGISNSSNYCPELNLVSNTRYGGGTRRGGDHRGRLRERYPVALRLARPRRSFTRLRTLGSANVLLTTFT